MAIAPASAPPSEDYGLPSQMHAFSVGFLAKHFDTTVQHWANLIEAGEIGAVNLGSMGAKKAMWRISRKSLLWYLQKRDSLITGA